jgi:SAM-dependent methyltransferase
VWTEQVVPRLADRALRGHEIGELRARVCEGLRGRVLEIGFGGGLNVRWYPPDVTAVSAVEPSDVGWRLSERRRARSAVPIDRTGLDGQRLEQDDDSIDSALSTFTLCSIPDAGTALAEVRRVLRPGGTLHVLEHGLAPTETVRRWQRRLDPWQQRVAGGCHLTRDVPALVRAAGFVVDQVESDYLPGPGVARPWGYGYLLRARG